MDQGRESPPQLPPSQQTTDDDSNGSDNLAGLQTDSQRNSNDSSEYQENSVQVIENHEAESADSLFAEFREQIEVFFSRAEDAFSTDGFDFDFAKDLVLRVRDVGHRYATMGCEESRLENIVVNRALTTVDRLVDGVNTIEEELYDPRQAMTYTYCALAVFPCTVQLKKNREGVVFHFSPGGSGSWSLLDELSRYCAIKTDWEEGEGLKGWENTIRHQRVLLALAEWLEVDRAAVTYLLVNKLMPVLATLVIRFVHHLPRRDQFQEMMDIAMVLAASSLVRHNFMKEARELHRLLTRVGTSSLSPSLTTRRLYVHARLLRHCGEFAKALEYARDALQGVTDPEERREIESLVTEVMEAQDNAAYRRSLRGPADTEWLAGTHAMENQVGPHPHDSRRHRHPIQTGAGRKKVKTVLVSRRGETPEYPPSDSQGLPTAPCPNAASQENLLSISQPSASGHYSDSSDSSDPCPIHPARHAPPLFSPGQNPLSLLDFNDSDDQDDEEDEEREDIRFVDSPDEDDEDDAWSVQDVSESDRLRMVTPGKTEDEDSNLRTWYERSEESIAKGEVVDEQGDTVELSEKQTDNLKRGGEGRGFYPDFLPNPQQLLKQDPKRYKRCQLKIERAHKAIAKVLDKGSKYTDILIDGRSKAGRTYMDDEVVVEILAEPGQVSGVKASNGASDGPAVGPVEKMAHGKVVGLINRVHFADVEHPVLFCTLDEIESHLMKPLCKTVPKIHVMNDNVRKNYPALVKNRIEIKTISPDGDIHFKGYCNVQPDKREQYVFKVVILSWRQGNIYPLGAVLDAHIGGKDYAGGLQVLSMQQRVPKYYPRAAVENTKKIVGDSSVTKTGRQDLTAERLFTIDPPGSKDLDDAISVRIKDADVIIGVHIADVAAVVKKDSGVDLEARRRAVTFYPLNRQPRCMLPEPLSHGKCSLLPGKERLAFSIFFRFNQNGEQVADPEVKRTVIRSRQQLTYEEAQRVIDGHDEGNVEPAVQEDIRQIHNITSKLRDDRLKQSMLFVPFEDPRLSELEDVTDSMDAHALIEELMVLANAHIATHLSRRPRYRDSMIVRCHKAPTYEELIEWQKKEGDVTNLVMQLQGKQITPNQKLSLDNRPRVSAYCPQPQVTVQRQVWETLCRHLEQGQVEEARRLAFMDALHPLQCLANQSWMELMETAQYRCAYGLNTPDLRHFGLSLPVYTHFTSPIRRYADVHVQRLLHADLDGRSPDCGPDEVTELCQHINSATARQKAFGKGCVALTVADSLQRQPLVFRAYVDHVDDDQLTMLVPSLLRVSDRKQEVPFSMLGVSRQPELVIDTALKKASVTVQWNRRFYDIKGHCPGPLRSVWQHLDKPEKKFSGSSVVMDLRPDQLSEAVRHEDWVRILKTLASNDHSYWNSAPQPISREKCEVEYMSSEKGDGTVSLMPVQFRRVYTRGQVVQIQMSAEPKKGLLKPRVEILHTARNACVCTQHVSDPVMTLSRAATRSTREQQFSSYKQYVKAWMPLLEMEAAMDAGSSDGSVVIDDVPVTIKQQKSPNGVLYRGSFALPAAFCNNRCIEFGGKSVDNIQRGEYKSDHSFPLDYLCLRYSTDCASTVVSRITESEVPDAVDRHFTWLAHASVVQVLHKSRQEEDGGEVVVIFALSDSSPQPPPQLMTERGGRVTLEILPKTEVDRRSQEMLLQLENPKCHLAQAIAFGRNIPKLDPAHRQLGLKDENHEVYIKEEAAASKLLMYNNKAQLAAIKLAMKNSLAIIQGPPGTGKTNIGIKLVYLFTKINRQLAADGKGRKTVLYCGPSNKSVDLVARELKKKLGNECPKMVRMYGTAIEAKDYPVPVGDIRSTRGTRDLRSDPELLNVSLHHLIREEGKPYAEKIALFEKYFDQCRKDPQKYSVTNKELKKYRRLVNRASIEELKHYEVVLCTCAVAGGGKLREGTEGSVFQVIIDECAMSPEPQSMVPIVATQAGQVVLIGDHRQLRPIIKCQPAAELGLDQSLFERLFLKFPKLTAFLDKQYRMDPQICAFPAREFYKGKLQTGYSRSWAEGLLLRFWPKHPPGSDTRVPHLFIDVRGEEETLTVTTDEGNERSKSNKLEADKVIEILTFLRKKRVDMNDVKLLTQYNAQRHLLETKLKTSIEQNVEHVFNHYDAGKVNVSTVVSSQGGEWDYVILSTVRSLPSYRIEPHPTHGWCRQNMGFITDRNQVNVALTRARKGLFIVGNAELLKCDQVWEHLIRRYTTRGCFFEDPDQFPPKNARRWRKRTRQPVATSQWQDVPRRPLPPTED